MALPAALTLVAGASLLWLAAPNQKAVTPPASRAAVRVIGSIALVAALALLLGQMGPATAVFTWATGLMLLWSVPPIVIGWLDFRRRNAG